MPRTTITAAIIALDEERNLPGLLSRLGWVDEVLVVDGGSVDATVEIARAHGARVQVRPFDNFSRQRNYAIEQARGDWVLSIDADERPTEALAAEVRERTCRAAPVAFRVPIRSSIFGRRFRYAGTQDDRPVRLFRRDAARWTGEVHEVLRVQGRVAAMRNWLEHETLPDLSAFLGKMDRYTTLAAEARVAAGQPPRPSERWLAPLREALRRLAWKKGLLDGPEGWAFCLLSGLSEWVLADKHRRLWEGGRMRSAECGVRNGSVYSGRIRAARDPLPSLRVSHPGRGIPHSSLSSVSY